MPRSPIQVEVPDLSDVEVRRRGQYDAGCWLTGLGQVEYDALAIRRLNKVSRQAGLQNRPAQVLVLPGENGQVLYIVPVKEHPSAVTVTYTKSKCWMNIAQLLAHLGYVPQPGSREFHRIDFADDQVQVGDLIAPALVLSMTAGEIKWKKGARKTFEAAQAAQKTAAPAEQ